MTVFANDMDLLRRFRAGNRDALSTVYWKYVSRVEAVTRRGLQLAGGRYEDLPDLVQEAFTRAFSASARLAYDPAREYGPLVVTIARNALVDHLRRRGREDYVALSDIERQLSDESAVEAVEPPWADEQTMALVERYVASLPPREHAVYVQRYSQGRSQLEAAQALGISRQQLRTLEDHLRGGLVRELARARLSGGAAGSLLSPASERVSTAERARGPSL
jgi:RNA polymerase sigma-70 factor (ECF subfamily)